MEAKANEATHRLAMLKARDELEEYLGSVGLYETGVELPGLEVSPPPLGTSPELPPPPEAGPAEA